MVPRRRGRNRGKWTDWELVELMASRNKPTASKKGDFRLGCLILITLILIGLFVAYIMTHPEASNGW